MYIEFSHANLQLCYFTIYATGENMWSSRWQHPSRLAQGL